MKKFIKSLFIVINFFLLLFFCSCSFLIQTPTTELSFSLGQNVAEEIITGLPERTIINDDTNLTLEVGFNNLNKKSISQVVTKKGLGDTVVAVNGIPLNREFSITVKIYYGAAVIYQAQSNQIILTEDNDKQNINLVLKEIHGKIVYKGIDAVDTSWTTEYYTDTPEWTLPTTPTKEGFTFKGWYTDNEKKIEKLGGNNPYLGDVTLTAKWSRNPHRSIKILKASEYEGSYGPKGLYVEFGYYPQSVMASGVTTENPCNYMGYYGYLGSDGCYYLKMDAPSSAAAKGDGWSGNTYRNGSTITSDPTYFKIEPIKWRVLDLNYVDASGKAKGALLLAEDILYAGTFITPEQTKSDYENSNLRTIFNNEICPKAFPPIEGMSDLIVPVRVSDTNTGLEEKIFALEYENEIYNKYGFPDKTAFVEPNKFPDPKKIILRNPTDYARANGAFIQDSSQFGWWWTRTIYKYNGENSGVRNVSTQQEVENIVSFGTTKGDVFTPNVGGIVPAVVIPTEALGDLELSPEIIIEKK